MENMAHTKYDTSIEPDTHIDFRKLIRDIEKIYNYKIQNMKIVAGVIAMINIANCECPNRKKCITFAYNILLYYWDKGTWRRTNRYVVNFVIDESNISQIVNDLVILASILDLYVDLVFVDRCLDKITLESSGNINIIVPESINGVTNYLNLFIHYNIKSLCIKSISQEIKDYLDDLPFDIILYERFA